MTPPALDGFDYARRQGHDGVTLNVATAGDGPAVVLLHGFPQTHLMWRHVAPELAQHHTVICPDLRGYGDSDKPPATSPEVYAKRTMALDVVELARGLGHDRFAVVGHDRGALVAFRTAMDHPERVSQLATLDSPTTLDVWSALSGVSAAVGWHLYLMAQPAGLPERMIEAVSDEFFGHFLDAWSDPAQPLPPDIRAAYLDASGRSITSIAADYRASATIDLEHDQHDRDQGRTLSMPCAAVQQDWGAVLGFDPAAQWRAWAPDVDHHVVEAGHFMAEQAPDQVLPVLRTLLGGPGSAARA